MSRRGLSAFRSLLKFNATNTTRKVCDVKGVSRQLFFFVVFLSKRQKRKEKKKLGLEKKSKNWKTTKKKPLSSSPRYDFAARRDDDDAARENVSGVRVWISALLSPVPRGRVQPSTIDREPMERDLERFSVGERALQTSAGGTQRRAEQRPRGNRKSEREKRGDIRAIAGET